MTSKRPLTRDFVVALASAIPNTAISFAAPTSRVRGRRPAMKRRVTRAERAEIVRLYMSGMASLAVAERIEPVEELCARNPESRGCGTAAAGNEIGFVSWASRTGEDSWVSRFVEDIRRARAAGRLGERFRAADVRRACPGWAARTYSVFLPKHREGNPGSYTACFRQNRRQELQLAELTGVRMDIGESLVGAYMRQVRRCHTVAFNNPQIESLNGLSNICPMQRQLFLQYDPHRAQQGCSR